MFFGLDTLVLHPKSSSRVLALSTLIEIAEFVFGSLAATTFDECFGLFESGVALVLILEVVVKETRVVLEMVGLAI